MLAVRIENREQKGKDEIAIEGVFISRVVIAVSLAWVHGNDEANFQISRSSDIPFGWEEMTLSIYELPTQHGYIF